MNNSSCNTVTGGGAKTEWRIGIIGAGVVGLTTALQIKMQMSNVQVTVYAEKFLKDTTSDGAAGIFRPGLNFCGPSYHLTRKWLEDAYNFYSDLLHSRGEELALQAGIVKRKVFMFSTKSPETVRNFYLEEILDDFRLLSKSEIEQLFPGKDYQYGSSFTTLLIECKKYLPFLTKRLEESGVIFEARKVRHFDDLPKDLDLIFNCSGLGAKQLCGDYKLTPIRGQVFKVSAPWVKDVIYVDTDTYIIPGTDGMVTLGGTRQFDSTNERVDRHDSDGIWERCTAALPSLRNSRVEKEWVGLRPYRPEVRVEKEVLRLQTGGTVKAIGGRSSVGTSSSGSSSLYSQQGCVSHGTLSSQIWAGRRPGITTRHCPCGEQSRTSRRRNNNRRSIFIAWLFNSFDRKMAFGKQLRVAGKELRGSSEARV